MTQETARKAMNGFADALLIHGSEIPFNISWKDTKYLWAITTLSSGLSCSDFIELFKTAYPDDYKVYICRSILRNLPYIKEDSNNVK